MFSYTAHIRIEDGKSQSVEEHCIETENLAGRYAKSCNMGKLAKIPALVHDIGKLCGTFHDYIHGQNNMRRGEIDHCYAGAKYLMEYAEKTGNIRYIEMAELLSRVVISHHGLKDWIDEDGEDYFTYRIGKDEEYQEIEENAKQMIPEEKLQMMFSDALPEYAAIRKQIVSLVKNNCENDRKKSHVQCTFYFGMLERLLSSFLVDADRTDTTNFQWNTEIDFSLQKDIWKCFSDKMEAKCLEFKMKTDPISILRSDISDRCKVFAENEVGICRMIVPTGGGKTISSLRFAINYCNEHGKERIFYIAPYMSILSQNTKVFRDILGNDMVLEHHSNFLSGIDSDDELAEYELRTEKWQEPVIVTTMVQFLNTLFSDQMSSVRRMHQLCNSVIIIDEVQSLPVKCVHLFNLAMNFLSAIGKSCIVLCSATQPGFEKTQFRMILGEKSSMTGNYEKDFESLKRTELVPVDHLRPYMYEEAADFCREQSDIMGNVLFVVNTRKAALELYNLLEQQADDDTEVFHLSTSICSARREKIIAEIREKLKHRDKKLICITTQLIEAGVDISFPCVIRSVAGLDNAVQAAGRCNRNGEYSYCCKVYLIKLAEEKTGRLKDIESAQKVTGGIIRNETYTDLLSVDTLSAYFEKYFQERCEDLSYRVKDLGINTNLVDLLSVNSIRLSLKNHKENLHLHAQAFKTAGRLFDVIDTKTIDVIVPDNEEAKALISQLYSETDGPDLIKILRRAQKYSIGTYADMKIKLLEKNAIHMLNCGVYVLDERFYDPKVGILLEGKSIELLMF